MRVSMMLSLTGLRVAEAREVPDGIKVHIQFGVSRS